MAGRSSGMQIRGILSVEDTSGNGDGGSFCPHWASACQVIAHVCVPLRKALIHFYLTCRDGPTDKMPDTWHFLIQLGRLFQMLVVPASASGRASMSGASNVSNSTASVGGPLPPVDPTDLYRALEKVIAKHQQNPETAGLAVRYLFQTILACVQALPSASYVSLWRNLLDISGMGLIVRSTIVGKRLEDDDFITQRTKKETRIQWCPLPLEGRMDSVSEGLDRMLLRRTPVERWDPKDYDFEVRVPTGWGSQNTAKTDSAGAAANGQSEADKTSDGDGAQTSAPAKPWKTTMTQLFQSLPDHLFLGLQRFVNEPTSVERSPSPQPESAEAVLLNEKIKIPTLLDLSKYVTPEYRKQVVDGSMSYHLVGGILCDDDNFVAIVKNPTVSSTNTPVSDAASQVKAKENDDKSDEDEPTDWSLLESDEIIRMTSSDVIEFLQGDGEEICGTVLIYTRGVTDPKSQQLLGDIIISHVSGHMNSSSDYYEEEIIEEEILDE